MVQNEFIDLFSRVCALRCGWLDWVQVRAWQVGAPHRIAEWLSRWYRHCGITKGILFSFRSPNSVLTNSVYILRISCQY